MRKIAFIFIASLSVLAPVGAASAVEVGVGDGGVYVDTWHRHHHHDRDCGWRHGHRDCW